MGELEKTFLIRDTLKDTGEIPSKETPTYSPDIICYQNHVLHYDSAVRYYDKYICKTFLQETTNLIYVRAKNNTGKEQKGEVKAYYSPLSLLYLPRQWKPLYTEKGDAVVEFRQPYSMGIKPDAIALSQKPFVLNKVEDPKAHHCMMAISRAEGEEWLELKEKFNGNADLWKFLREHSNIAYNNIVIEQSFSHQHSQVVMLGNHNSHKESFAVKISIANSERCAAETFGSCNIGSIQILCTDIDNPLDITITPKPEDDFAVSKLFELPENYEGSVIITYFAADRTKRVHGTLKHDYITQDSQNKLPINTLRTQNSILTTCSKGIERVLSHEAKLGDFSIVFCDDEENDVKSLDL